LQEERLPVKARALQLICHIIMCMQQIEVSILWTVVSV
jgi:hypothetical protein